jgi:eukaryotic-like serine/threonine-protein kinase
MTDEKWRSVHALFHEASGFPPERRRAFVEAASVDPEITLTVLELLEDTDVNDNVVSRAGTRIGRYVVIDRLGRGGMGEVYSARDSELDRIVALKFLSPELNGGPQFVERFVREAKAASALNHPNIVTVYEVAQSESGLAIAMELVDGPSVREYCGAPLPALQVAAWGRQIAQALAAAHARGIVHRDIKPENLMVRGDGYIKVLDFGLARRQMPGGGPGSTNLSGLFAGTLNYMSPEQTRGERATAASDIFSFGLVLFELTFGKHPFLSDSPIDTAHAIAHNELEIPAETNAEKPRALVSTITATLAKDPGQRLTALEVEHRLGAIGPGSGKYTEDREPLTAGRRSPANRLGKLAAKYKYLMVALIAAMVLCIAAVGGWFVRGRLPAPAKLTLRQLTLQIPENRVTTAAVSRDGKLLAYATVDGIFLRAMRTGEARLLRSPGDFWIDRIRWLPDGDRLLAGGFSRTSSRPAIWIVSIAGGEPVLFRENARDPEPTQDGSQIAFTDPTRTELWISGASREEPRRVLAAAPDHLVILFWSAAGTHLAFTRSSNPIEWDPTVGIPRFATVGPRSAAYESLDVRSGQVAVRRPDLTPASAAVLRSGSVLFLSADANRLAGSSLWRIETDPRTGIPLTPPVRLPLAADLLTDVSAGSDGRTVSLVRGTGLPTVHVGDYSAAGPAIRNVRRLTLDSSASYPHAWTTDSGAVIFESDRGGNNDVFRQDLGGRVAEMLVATPREDFHANLTPDGRWLLFMQGPLGSRLPAAVARAPVTGRTAEEVVKRGVVDEFRCALPGGKRCIARAVRTDQTYIYYELDPIQGLGRELARTRWLENIYGDWALSPDGTEIAIPNHDPRTAVIRILSLDKPGRPEQQLSIAGLANLSGLNWTADGTGWFVVITRTRLVHVDRTGRVTPLLDNAGYTIPSPDGRRVAMMIRSITTNVWSVEGL